MKVASQNAVLQFRAGPLDSVAQDLGVVEGQLPGQCLVDRHPFGAVGVGGGGGVGQVGSQGVPGHRHHALGAGVPSGVAVAA